MDIHLQDDQMLGQLTIEFIYNMIEDQMHGQSNCKLFKYNKES